MISSVARKYARALLEVSLADNLEDAVLQELQTFSALLRDNSELRSTLDNPVLPFPSKRAIIEALGPRIPISSAVQNFVLIVISNGRIHQFADLVEAFSQALDEKRGVRRGIVYSAQSLKSPQRERVAQGMEKLTGSKVRLDFKQDEDLIGGIKIRMGSTIFDGSIRAQLNELERKLADR